MATVDSNNAAQQALFDKLGISTTSGSKPNAKLGNGNLGQDEFLKLMTTQLQNQDPFAPMENGDFIGPTPEARPTDETRSSATACAARRHGAPDRRPARHREAEKYHDCLHLGYALR